MVVSILTFLKGNVIKVAGLAVVVGLLYAGWLKIESSIFDAGYNKAQQEVAARYDTELNEKAALFKDKLDKANLEIKAQHKKYKDRVEAEKKIDKEVEYVTKIIKEKEYVVAECNNVHTDIVGMYNKAITNINTANHN